MMDGSLSKLTLILHLHGMCSHSCKFCPWHLVAPDEYLDLNVISHFFEKFKSMGYSFNDIFIMCPNPFDHPNLRDIYRMLRDNCRKLNVLTPVNDLLKVRIGVLRRDDRLFLLVDSFPKLSGQRHNILALESHGFNNVEVIYPIISKVNDSDIQDVLEFCRVRGLHLGFIQGSIHGGFDLVSLISKVGGVCIGERCGFLAGCFSERIAFYKDFPFRIITTSYRSSCDTIYLNNLGLVSRCPLSEDFHRIEEFEFLDLDDLECPMNPKELSFIPRIRFSLISPSGVEIDETELEILDMIARSRSLRAIAQSLKVSHTSIRKRIMNLEERLSTKLLERGPHTGKSRLTKVGWKIVEEYRRLRKRYGGSNRLKMFP